MNLTAILSKFNVTEDVKNAISAKYDELHETISNEDTGKSTCDDIRRIVDNLPNHKDKEEIQKQVDDDLNALQRDVTNMLRVTENLKRATDKLSPVDQDKIIKILNNFSGESFCDELITITRIIQQSEAPDVDRIKLEIVLTEIFQQILAVTQRCIKRKSESLQAEIERKSEEIDEAKRDLTETCREIKKLKEEIANDK